MTCTCRSWGFLLPESQSRSRSNAACELPLPMPVADARNWPIIMISFLGSSGGLLRVAAATVVFLQCFSGRALGDAPQPAPEHKRLEILVGNWIYKGEFYQTPIGPKDTINGRATNRFVLNGFFVESKWKETGTQGE